MSYVGKDSSYREGLTPMPERIKRLKVDPKFRVPVPWFVPWIEGVPEFRGMDGPKFVRALREKLCWVCGDKLGVNVCFVAGPMCGINRTSSEPPSHLECGRWSAMNCPFLSNPAMVRREDEQVNNANLAERSAGMAIARNPGVAMLWITRSFEIFRDDKRKPLIMMGEPTSVEWYARGRPATRAEVQESINTGLPVLEAVARTEPGATAELARYVERFQKYLPAE